MSEQCEKGTGTTGIGDVRCVLRAGHSGSHWAGSVGWFRWEPPAGQLAEDIEESVAALARYALDVLDTDGQYAVRGSVGSLRSVIQSHINGLTKERDAAIARAETAERTLREWEADYGALIRQSRQHITTEDADVPVRAADRDGATLTMPFTDGGKDGAR